jgi:hypothetical protein
VPDEIDHDRRRFLATATAAVAAGCLGLERAPLGTGQVVEPRLYQLIRQPPPIADRTFEIEVLDTEGAWHP